MKIYKRVISLILTIITIISLCIPAYAAGGPRPDAEESGVSPKGKWNSGGCMVSLVTFEPSKCGLDIANKSKWEVGVGGGKFDNPTERMIYDSCVKTPNLPLPKYEKGGADSWDKTQLYCWASCGLNDAKLYTSKGNMTNGSSGHKVISAAATAGLSGSEYKQSGGIFSIKNPIVSAFMSLSNNGKNIDYKVIGKKMEDIWWTYVNPSGANVENSGMVLMRKGIASMFMSNTSAANSIAYYNSMQDNLKKGGVVEGLTIESEEQANAISQFIIVGFAMTLGNPTAGLTIFGTKVPPAWGYKYDNYLKTLQRWAAGGGNSTDPKSCHIAIRFDAYSERFRTEFARFDTATIFSLENCDPSKVSIPVSYTGKYTLSSHLNFTAAYCQAVIDANKAVGLAPVLDHRTTEDSLYVDSQTLFHRKFINRSGAIGTGNSEGMYMGIFSVTSKGYYNKQRTLAMGFTYMAPVGIAGKGTGTSGPVNIKMNAALDVDKTDIKKGEEASLKSYIDMKWPSLKTEEDIKKYPLQVASTKKTDNYRSPTDELASMLSMIERIQDGKMTDATNKLLPVEITIRRSIVNGSGTDPKIIDDQLLGQTMMASCGQHNLRVISDNGSTAVIGFNLLPASGHDCSVGSQYSQTSVIDSSKQFKTTNCALTYLLTNATSRIKFQDNGIKITNTPGDSTTVNYDYSVVVKFPSFQEQKEVFGDATTDLQRNLGTRNGYGYSSMPINGSVYPYSDWTPGYYMSPTIRRSVTFTRDNEGPSYTNVGYDFKNPSYAEIKQGSPTNEQFEAMAGTPTTRDLYTSVSGTDFRVDFKSDKDARQNGQTYRTYVYKVHVSGCTNGPTPCAGGCGSCANPCPGHPTKDGTITHSNHKQHTIEHPQDHDWTYTVQIPIENFSYFDMTDSEVWRMNSWGINGGAPFLTSPSPTYNMETKCWTFNQQNYYSGNGRLVFSEAMNSNENGDLAKYGDCVRSFTVDGSGGHQAAIKAACALVNAAKNSEKAFTADCISDYVVLQTSEGYQVPYFYSQHSSTSASPSSATDFTGEGGYATTTDKIKWDSVKTMNDLWWGNSSKATCASETNGWSISSITYAGYNGNYSSLSTKYVNGAHKAFLTNENPLDKLLSKYGLDKDKHPSQIHDGPGTTSMGKDTGNTDHIKKQLDVVDTTPNGEYDTGQAWLQYNRVSFYKRNSNQGATSGTAGKFTMTGAGIYRNENVPYYEGAPKINDIVIHDPVTAQNAVVICNDKKYDLRTNAALMQGGDPVGLTNGICPMSGCQFSTLTCTTPLTPHTTDCYQDVVDTEVHVGGNNSHVHTAACYHHHTSACYAQMEYEWAWDGNGCSYDGTRAWSTSNTVPPPNPGGHNCTVWRLTGATRNGTGGTSGTCTCYHCGNPNCPNYCSNHQYACAADCQIAHPQPHLICGMTEGQLICNNLPLNVHVCTAACSKTMKKVLICTNPHHYEPGEPTNQNDPKFHYPLGDPRCWTRCGNDANHSEPDHVVLPDGDRAQAGGVFINLDREFKIYYPFTGDFAEDPSMNGIKDTTQIRGKGYVNSMYCKEWTEHRWVYFPVNVIDPHGEMRLANTQIDLNEFSRDDETFTFYCVLANNEQCKSQVKFTSTAINAPVDNRDDYFDESVDITNRDRVDPIYAARHTAHKYFYIDVVGYIGALTLNDTGDFRFANLFKTAKGDGSWLIENLVPEVFLNKPNYVLSDNKTVRLDDMTKESGWLNTYGNLFNVFGGKSGGENADKEPLSLPLVPRYNNIPSLRNQPMRPGYQLYMDIETDGNYAGETMDGVEGKFVDQKMYHKMQVRPSYYSLDLVSGEYTPLDVYYGVNGEYMKVNDYQYRGTDDTVGVHDYYYYLDWLNESARRNFTNAESSATDAGKLFRSQRVYKEANNIVRSPTSERDVLGSANVLFLNDLDRTFSGSSKTYGVDKNPGNLLQEGWYNSQSQRWHFTLGLPSSSVFVKTGDPCTEANIQKLWSKDKVIVCTADIKVQGEVWTLQYNGMNVNQNGFQVFDGGRVYQPPRFDENGNPTNDPTKDVTSDDPVITIYPSAKTSKDDVISSGTH